MSLLRVQEVDLESGFPRVSGDEPRSQAARKAAATFSPRERG